MLPPASPMTWVAALRAWIRHPRSKKIQLSYLMALGLMNVCSVGAVYHFPEPGWTGHFVPIIQLLTSAFLPSTFLHYFLIAPSPIPRTPRWFRRLIHLPAVVLLGLWLWKYYQGVPYRRSFFLVIMEPYEVWGLLYFVLYSVAAQGALIYNRFWAPTRPLRRQAKWLLIGIGAGLIPLTVFISAPLALGYDQLRFSVIPAYTLILIPICYVVAIIRHRLMDLELMLNRSAVYAIASSLAIGLYLLGITAFGWVFTTDYLPRTFSAISVLVVAVLFAPVKSLVQNWIDKAFHREQYRYRETLDALSRSLSSILGLRELAETVLNDVTDAMHIRGGALLVQSEEGFRIEATQAELLPGLAIPADDPWLRYLEGSQAPLRTRALPREQVSSGMATLNRRFAPVVWVPFLLRGDLIAVLLLGPKLSEEAYTYEDISLLGTLVHHGGVAIQNALLYKELRLRTEALEQARDELMLAYVDTYGGKLPNSHQGNVVADFQAIATALKQSYERLMELDALKTQFVSNVTHELATPLTHIKGFVDNLLQGVGGELSEKQQRYLNRIADNSDRLIRLINDLLDLSRIDSGRLGLNLEPIELSSLVDETAFSLQAAAMLQQVELTCCHVDGLLALEADPDKLKQILLNLLGNALKFTAPGGKVTVTTKAIHPHEITIHVEDTGIGIPPEEHENIFERFHQVPGTKARGTHGTGLGLSIVKTLVDLHDGDISVESTIGQGSRFSVVLPRRGVGEPCQTKAS